MGHGHAYEAYGIDKTVGAIIVVRPDQCECFSGLLDIPVRLTLCIVIPFHSDVALIVGLDDTEVLEDYFSSFLQAAKDGGFPGSLICQVKPPSWEVDELKLDIKENLLQAQDIPTEELLVV